MSGADTIDTMSWSNILKVRQPPCAGCLQRTQQIICSSCWLSQWLYRVSHHVNTLQMLTGTWKPEECLICQLSAVASCLDDSNSGAFYLLPIEIWQLLIKYLHSDFSHTDSTFGPLVDDNYMLGKHLKFETDPIEQNDLPLKLNKNGHPSSQGRTYDKSQTQEAGRWLRQ